MGAYKAGIRRYQFLESCGSLGQALLQPREIVDCLVEAGSEAELIIGLCPLCCLQMAEQPSSSWDGNRHGPELPDELIPFVQGQPLAVGMDLSQAFG
jgi:hypothetical protein